MKLTTMAKHALQNTLAPDLPAVVVTSLGRSGSTVVYDAAVAAMTERRFSGWPALGRRIVRDQIWTLGERPLAGGCVYKTHDLPAALTGQDGTRCVFLFGSTVEAALSVHSALERFGRDWVESHFEHLQSDGRIEDLFNHDVLGFREQIRQWSTLSSPPTLCLRYETLWDHQQDLSAFLGVEIVLPERRARVEKSVDPESLTQAQAIYGPICRIVESLPDCFRAGPEMIAHFEEAAL